MDKKNITQKILVLIFIGLLVTGGYYFFKSFWGTKKIQGIISVSGRIEADEYNASSKVAGKVEKLLVDEGQDVKRGQLLAYLYSKQLEEQLTASQKEINLWEDKLRQSEFALEQTRIYTDVNINQAQSNLERARANLAYNEKEYQRYKNLIKEDAVPKTKFDAVETQYISSKEEYNIAKNELKRVSNAIENSKAVQEVKSTKAILEKSKALFESTKADLDDAKIYSPVAGRIVSKIVEPGEVIAAGTPVFTIINMDKLYLKVFLPTNQAGKLKIGNPVKIVPDALSGESFEGIIYKISDQAEFTPKNVETKEQRAKLVFAVKIRVLNNKERKLKPGMPAEALIDFTKVVNMVNRDS